VRAALDVAGEQPHDGIGARREGLHQLGHPRHDLHPGSVGQQRLQLGDVSVEESRQRAADVLVAQPGRPHEVEDDLGIGLAAEVVVRDGPGRSVHRHQRAPDGEAPGAAGCQERAVDVEEEEPHASGALGMMSQSRMYTRMPGKATDRMDITT
jgi:hypothetical protein